MKNNGIVGALHPSAQLVLLIALALVCLAVFSTLGFFVYAAILGADLTELLAQTEDLIAQGSLGFMRFAQIINHLSLFIIPSLIFSWLVGKHPMRYLQGSRSPLPASVLLSVLIITASLPLVNYLIAFNAGLHLPEALAAVEDWMRMAEDRARNLTHRFLEVVTWQELAFNIFMIAVIPSIGEEFMFRGILQKLFKQWTGSAHLAVWISAIIFSAMHLQFYGFFPRLLLGAILGYMLVATGNIWVPVLAHFFNNAAAVTLFYLHHNHYIDVDIEKIGMGAGALVFAFVSLIATAMLIILLFQLQRKNLQS